MAPRRADSRETRPAGSFRQWTSASVPVATLASVGVLALPEGFSIQAPAKQERTSLAVSSTDCAVKNLTW
ncbi:hypothetical protein SNOUR_10020 [Streptomyces noursei ATCC 11455]|nr:hypothetical protein SNOUR_10020 [Streptomyces noursei ATCC 11455]